jgi:uncharacterized protein (DUF2147 family)
MKRLLAIAALLLASSTAQAQYSFEYGGRTIRIDPDRGTISIPGVYDNTGRKTKRTHTDNARSKSPPQEAKSDPQASPAPPEAPTTAPVAPPPASSATASPPATNTTAPPEPATTTANNAPVDATIPPAPPASPPPVALRDPVPAPAPEPSPTVAAVPPPAPAPAPRPQPANSPLGVWLTQEKEGKVRIEQCGANLCGYSIDAKSNLNGEQVLINMHPSKDQKWSGRILDPNTGSTYDSTIALQGNVLRVQGCAFGGMFCGGQTWTRVN